VILVALIFISDVLSRKNISEACSVRNFWSVVQMLLIDNLCYF
jgi:hypothetical protein